MPASPDRRHLVNLFFATYNHDPEIVRKGLRDNRQITYPVRIQIRCHVLDDGSRPQMAAVTADERANYFT